MDADDDDVDDDDDDGAEAAAAVPGADRHPLHVLPLYAMLSTERQAQVSGSTVSGGGGGDKVDCGLTG